MGKKCFKCEIIKPLNEFYVHKQMADGHLNKCKECTKKEIKDNYNSNLLKDGFIESERKRGRVKYHTLYKDKVYKNRNVYRQKWSQNYPEKKEASIKSSHIKKEGFEKHHWSYNKEHYKDIIFLTKKEHSKAHRFIIYDQERKMYRRFDNNVLLDNIESHKQFILDCILNKED